MFTNSAFVEEKCKMLRHKVRQGLTVVGMCKETCTYSHMSNRSKDHKRMELCY